MSDTYRLKRYHIVGEQPADLNTARVDVDDARLGGEGTERSRQPVVLAYPESQIASSFNSLAARLGGIDCSRAGGGTFFRRVFRWLT